LEKSNKKEKLKLTDITKSFPGVIALKNVSMVLYENEILGICGENGSGKSTLIKIISGIYQADDGEIYHNDKLVCYRSPAESIRAGISVIQQELSYLNSLSVAENVYQGRLPSRHGIINWKKLFADTAALMKKYDIDIDPKTIMQDLPLASKQLVEVIKAISINAGIIIMDEPTSSLGLDDVSRLVSIIRNVAKDGILFMFISHRLEELFEVCDRLIVLRDGENVGEFKKKDFDHNTVVSRMVGRTITQQYNKREISHGDVVLKIQNINSDILKNVSLQVRAGEIVGLYGMAGAGQEAILETVFGLTRKWMGSIFLDEKLIKPTSPFKAIKNGIAYVSAERKRDGVVLCHSVENNILIANLDKIVSNGWINYKRQSTVAKKWVENLNIRISGLSMLANNLSGGNQQKVVLARWLERQPKVLLLNEPTRGIDVGAKREIFALIQDMCEKGVAVLMITSDMLEMLNMADRVYTVYNGRITGQFSKEEATQDKLMLASIDKLDVTEVKV